MQSVILDIGYPMDAANLEFVITALGNVLTLASSIKVKSSHRTTPYISIIVVNADVQNAGAIYPQHGDMKKIQASMNSVRLMGKTNLRVSEEEYKDLLHLALKTTLNHHQSWLRSEYGGDYDPVRAEQDLRIGVVSAKPVSVVRRLLAATRTSWSDSKDADSISAIQVLDVCRRTGVSMGWQIESEEVDLEDDPEIIAAGRAISPSKMQYYLKRLLIVPDPQIVILTTPSVSMPSPGGKNAKEVSAYDTLLLCQATPSVIHPGHLPKSVSECFFIMPGGDEDQASVDGFIAGEASRNFPTRRFVVKSRLDYNGVCEGCLYGMPYYVSPITRSAAASAGFSTSNDDLTDNKKMFWALHHFLTEKDEVLLVQIKDKDGGCGNFLLFTGGDCLLLQAVRTEELSLPAGIEASVSISDFMVPSTPHVKRVEKRFQGIPKKEDYTPSDFPTGIFSSLTTLMKGCPRGSNTGRKRTTGVRNENLLSYLKMAFPDEKKRRSM